ncbi:MAG TPA: hypothetical protein VHX66_11035 [Solirubrobacteraceae bacterium]|jgi:hypothetical protein|nr:hypothetical protein [Solirubrobacteraceae bacterium]
MRRRTVCAALALLALALAVPAVAEAFLATITNPADPGATPSCPGSATVPCTVVSRTTAIQVEVGTAHDPFKITATARIVGWQIALSAPTAAQVRFFDEHEGGSPEAALAIVRPSHALEYRLDYVSPLVHLEPYFGRTATFALPTSVLVHKGDEIALSVPTWAPALELNAGRRAAWRASRATGACNKVTLETAQLQLGGVSEYSCIYRTALIDFGAIEISTP